MNKKFLIELIYCFYEEAVDSYTRSHLIKLIYDINKIESENVYFNEDLYYHLTVKQVSIIENVLYFIESDTPFKFASRVCRR